MEHTHLEDAEALRSLWDDVEILEREARLLRDAAARLTHTVRHHAQTWVAGSPGDPRHLLLEVGAALERCTTIDLVRAGIEDALSSLGFASLPNPSPHPRVAERATLELAARLTRRPGGPICRG